MTDPIPSAPPGRHYRPLTVVLHWLGVVLVGVLWLQPRLWIVPPLRDGARGWHLALGIVLAVCLAIRIVARATGLARRREKHSDLVAEAMHLTLYLLLLATIALGACSLWARGEILFGVLTIPAFAPGNPAVWRALAGLHGLAADLVVVLVGVHVTAALAHHFLWHDRLLHRMLPAHTARRQPAFARSSRGPRIGEETAAAPEKPIDGRGF